MKRAWIGAGLLLALLAAGLLTGWWMDSCHSPIGEDLTQAAQAAMAEDWGRAETLTARAAGEWERCRKGTAAFADHTPLEKIDGLFAELRIYAAAREPVHFAATCATLSRQVDAMGEAHGLMWWNIL